MSDFFLNSNNNSSNALEFPAYERNLPRIKVKTGFPAINLNGDLDAGDWLFPDTNENSSDNVYM